MRDKNSSAYSIFRQRVGYLKAKMIANKLTPTDLKPQMPVNQALTVDSESDDVTNKKRKRKSRWANDNCKIPAASPIGIIPPATVVGLSIPQPVNAQTLGNF